MTEVMDLPTKTTGRRGRAAGGSRAKRGAAIFEVAITVFLEEGFENASMALIAKRARASKETLYNHFGSKEKLFALIIREMASRLTMGLEADNPQKTPEEVLRNFGKKLLAHVSSPRIIQLYRVLIAEVRRDPALGEIFEEHGPQQGRRQMAEYLAAETRRGRLRCSDPASAAMMLASMVIGNHLQRSLIGTEPPMSASEMKRWVGEAVKVFLAHYGVRKSTSR